MMKKILFLLAMVCAMCTYAQTEQSDIISATLQHGNETTVFYGQNSLVRAVNAAADAGDVIRLSAGYFDGVSIRKQLSVYGVGFEGDAEAGLARTRTGGINISQDGEKTNGCYLEGLHIDGTLEVSGALTKNITIVKCRAGSIYLSANTEDVTIRQCVSNEVYTRYKYSSWSGYYGTDGYAKNLQVLNSITGGINYFVTTEDIPSTVYVDHSIISGCYGAYVLTNSVVNANSIGEGATARGCVFPGSLDESKYTTEGNFYKRAMSTVFTDGVNNSAYEVDGVPRDLVVADDLVGIDGQSIGVHGGNYKFNKIPNVPRILSFSATPSDDGKKVTLNLKADVPQQPQ